MITSTVIAVSRAGPVSFTPRQRRGNGMTSRRASALFALLLLATHGCSSGDDDGTAPIGVDSGADTGAADVAAPDTKPKPDTAPEAAADTAPPADKTTGKPCTSSDDCDTTGLGNEYCSTSAVIGSFYPTPVCLGSSCDPGDTTKVATCDE